MSRDLTKCIYSTRKGDLVRSKYEQSVANHLYKNGIEYIYEKELNLPGHKAFKPDFFLPEYNGYIEVLGVYGNRQYNYFAYLKKKIFRENGIKVIYLHHSGGWKNGAWKWFLSKGFEGVFGVKSPAKAPYIYY